MSRFKSSNKQGRQLVPFAKPTLIRNPLRVIQTVSLLHFWQNFLFLLGDFSSNSLNFIFLVSNSNFLSDKSIFLSRVLLGIFSKSAIFFSKSAIRVRICSL